MQELVCYCFGYTASEIEQDVALNGRSTIMEKILSEKKQAVASAPTKTPKDADVSPMFARW